MCNRAQFCEAVKRHIGVPYRHQGRNAFGLDCVGMVAASIKALGFNGYTDSNDYSKLPNDSRLLSHLDAQFIRLKNKDAFENGDILVFKIFDIAQHMGVYMDGQLIHATQESKFVVAVGFDARWQKRHVHTYTLKEFL